MATAATLIDLLVNRGVFGNNMLVFNIAQNYID
jgi:hypothetical protein